MNGAQATPVPTREPKKTARPTVDLYVMAFCPYGTQAETVMRPVKDLLASKADIRIRYITTISGSTIDTVKSLHGPSEAKEDAYQVCVMKSQPEKYWEYVRLFNEQCYPKWQDSESLGACRSNVTTTLKIDSSAIGTCAAGADAVALLKADETDADSNGASGSPTLIINGVTYVGARTPEAYKQAICNSFETAPAECSTTLSSAAVTGAVGNC
jgi:glutaredoxin